MSSIVKVPDYLNLLVIHQKPQGCHKGIRASICFKYIKKDKDRARVNIFEYGFQEDIDFASFSTKSTGGRPSTDYALSIDCAKEISMLQRNEKGR